MKISGHEIPFRSFKGTSRKTVGLTFLFMKYSSKLLISRYAKQFFLIDLYSYCQRNGKNREDTQNNRLALQDFNCISTRQITLSRLELYDAFQYIRYQQKWHPMMRRSNIFNGGSCTGVMMFCHDLCDQIHVDLNRMNNGGHSNIRRVLCISLLVWSECRSFCANDSPYSLNFLQFKVENNPNATYPFR